MAVDEAFDPVSERFWRRVRKTDACWDWTGSISGGYGRIRVDGRRVQAHRLSYEMTGREIPAGMQLDHLCRNTRCVNPAHLEPVTPRENYLRGDSPMAQQARQTHCGRGHELAGDNVRVRGNKRECLTCARAGDVAWKIANRETINAGKRRRYALTKVGG